MIKGIHTEAITKYIKLDLSNWGKDPRGQRRGTQLGAMNIPEASELAQGLGSCASNRELLTGMLTSASH